MSLSPTFPQFFVFVVPKFLSPVEVVGYRGSKKGTLRALQQLQGTQMIFDERDPLQEKNHEKHCKNIGFFCKHVNFFDAV